MAHAAPIPQMKTLNACLDKMVEQGYVENFRAAEGGLQSFDSDKIYGAKDINIVNFYRFEGISNPDDNSVLYVIETSDGKKGTLIDAYGAYADPEVAKLIVEVEEIQKQKDFSPGGRPK
ncbi:hypothetical protein [Ohtaekwangia sp.]|uniref:hypothetical protein n=1 Tax=Ohtaekwangia sp. TaxID=2066019 RepID=UPI002F94B060